MVYCGAVWFIVVRCGLLWCGVVYCGAVWFIVVRCGLLWCGVVYCSAVWFIVVRCGLLWLLMKTFCHTPFLLLQPIFIFFLFISSFSTLSSFFSHALPPLPAIFTTPHHITPHHTTPHHTTLVCGSTGLWCCTSTEATSTWSSCAARCIGHNWLCDLQATCMIRLPQ